MFRVAKYYRVLTTQIYSSIIIAAEEVKRRLVKHVTLDKARTKCHLVGGRSAPAEGPSHSIDQPGGKVHGQVRLAIISSKLVPESSAISKAEYTNTKQGLPVTGYILV
jgi:hypothetical protein